MLRNAIGNYYEQRVRKRVIEFGAETDSIEARTPTPLESLQSDEALRLIQESLQEMANDDEQCGRYLRRILEGTSSRARAGERDGGSPASPFRRAAPCARGERVS